MVKKVIVIMLMMCGIANGVIQYELEYGVAATIDFPLFDSNSPWALYETVPGTPDVNIFRDQGDSESSDNLVTDEGSFMSLTISAAEMTAKTITVVIKDATSPRAFMDQVILITTYGNASALRDPTTLAVAFSDAPTIASMKAEFDPNIAAILADTAVMQPLISTNLDLVMSDVNSTLDADITLILADTAAIEPIVTDVGGLSEIGDKIVADMDANSSLLANLDLALSDVNSTLGADIELILADTGTDGVVLAADAITEAKIADNAIAAEHIAASAIGSSEIATGAIDADALAADAVAEIWAIAMEDLAATPGVTAEAVDALNFLFMLARNKTTTTTSEIAIYKDDSATKMAESDISDSGGTFTKGEYGTPD